MAQNPQMARDVMRNPAKVMLFIFVFFYLFFGTGTEVEFYYKHQENKFLVQTTFLAQPF